MSQTQQYTLAQPYNKSNSSITRQAFLENQDFATMEIDAASRNIGEVVRKAREEIAGVITALTELLGAVAVPNNPPTKVETNGPSANAAQPKPEPRPKPSLEPVMTKLQSLRTTVEQAVSQHASILAQAQKGEADITTEERAALTERRAALVAEVRTKNEKVKLLIDRLRDLHRDIVMLLSSYYKPITSQPR